MKGRASFPVFVFACVLAVPALAYEDVDARTLERELKGKVGRQVRFIDQLAIEWSSQDQQGWLRFDTYRFRCVISAAKEAELKLLRETLATRLPARLLQFSGTVTERNGMIVIEIEEVHLAKYPARGQRRVVWWD